MCRQDATFNDSSLDPEWFINAMKPSEARPTGSGGPAGLDMSTSRSSWKSAYVRGGFDQLVKRAVRASSVKRSFLVIRSFVS